MEVVWVEVESGCDVGDVGDCDVRLGSGGEMVVMSGLESVCDSEWSWVSVSQVQGLA